MAYKPKYYVKVFKVTNKDGTFTKEDYDNLIKNFEVIRKLYYKEELDCDSYSSFSSITREIKRAAHNSNLKAELQKIDYKAYTNESITVDSQTGQILEKNITHCITLNNDTEYSYNLEVYFKRIHSTHIKREFIITSIKGFEKEHISGGKSSTVIFVDPNMRFYRWE